MPVSGLGLWLTRCPALGDSVKCPRPLLQPSGGSGRQKPNDSDVKESVLKQRKMRICVNVYSWTGKLTRSAKHDGVQP